MVSTMSADLVSLPLLHQPKVSTALCALMVFIITCAHRESPLFRAPIGSLLCARSKVRLRARVLKGLATNETTAQSRDCAVAAT